MNDDAFLENTVQTLAEESMEKLIETAHGIIDQVNTAVDSVNGSDIDLVETLGMALGLAAGRLGFSRGGMLEILLDWYDEGTTERQEYLDNPEIEVELEPVYQSVKKGSN